MEIVHRAVEAYERPDRKVQPQGGQAKAEPFTFKVPVTLAGLQLYADFRVSKESFSDAPKVCHGGGVFFYLPLSVAVLLLVENEITAAMRVLVAVRDLHAVVSSPGGDHGVYQMTVLFWGLNPKSDGSNALLGLRQN